MRKLASIQKIISLKPIKGADTIEVAEILGWKVVVRKGEYRVGDLCIYCEIDSILPAKPEFEFLASKNYRIKTIQLRGQISQGIAFPLNIIPAFAGDVCPAEGSDVTEIMGVTKWDPPEVTSPHRTKLRMGKTAGSFPKGVPRTDEVRLQAVPAVLEELRHLDQAIVITEKVDGTSATFAQIDGKIYVCSRSTSRKDPLEMTLWQKFKEWWKYKIQHRRKNIPESCVYWDIARKYNIPTILKMYNNLAIQGEIAGPNIQGNKLRLKEEQLFVFNIYDINSKCYFDSERLQEFCQLHNLPTVKILYKGKLPEVVRTVEDMIELSKGFYDSGHLREGIVVRTSKEQLSSSLGGRFSFKVINPEFLLKS